MIMNCMKKEALYPPMLSSSPTLAPSIKMTTSGKGRGPSTDFRMQPEKKKVIDTCRKENVMALISDTIYSNILRISGF